MVGKGITNLCQCGQEEISCRWVYRLIVGTTFKGPPSMTYSHQPAPQLQKTAWSSNYFHKPGTGDSKQESFRAIVVAKHNRHPKRDNIFLILLQKQFASNSSWKCLRDPSVDLRTTSRRAMATWGYLRDFTHQLPLSVTGQLVSNRTLFSGIVPLQITKFYFIFLKKKLS